MASEKVVQINDGNFESEVLNSSLPVLIDFGATWCAPCRAVAPLIEQLAEEYEGRAKVASLDVDDSPGTASKYGIRSVPTLMVFKDGELVTQQVGALPKAKIAALIDQAL